MGLYIRLTEDEAAFRSCVALAEPRSLETTPPSWRLMILRDINCRLADKGVYLFKNLALNLKVPKGLRNIDEQE